MDAKATPTETPGKKFCILHKCPMMNCPMELPLEPGQKVTCPVCGSFTAPDRPMGKILYYRQPMRPEITSAEPKKDESGMDYIPVYAQDENDNVGVQGQATTLITPERRRLIGLKSEPIVRRKLSVIIRASGRVAYDPDLYNTMTEYREAVRARDQVRESPLTDVRERSEALVRSSELRLRQMGLSDEQIEEAKQAESPPTNLLVGGKGQSVWVYAQVYEYEIGWIKVGQEVEINTPAYPGRVFHGRLKSIDPNLSAETRSLRVRIETPNPEGLLKLEMYANALIHADLGIKLALPEAALFNTGERQVVFIDLGDGRIEPRDVRVGQEARGYYEVLSGVREAESVVTSANFLIDSESKLKAAFAGKAPQEKKKRQEERSQEHRH